MDDTLLHINNQVSISRSELSFRFSRSSGPGGQHVQKSSTRVELLFDVKVDSVKTSNMKGKSKRFGQMAGRRADWKKAYVKLQPGQDIDFMGAQ